MKRTTRPERSRCEKRTLVLPQLRLDLDVWFNLFWLGKLLEFGSDSLGLGKLDGFGGIAHKALYILPGHDQSGLVHGVEGKIHIWEHMLNGLDHVEPDRGPKPVASGGGVVVTDIDGHFKGNCFLAEESRVHTPERLEVMVDLIKKVLDDESIVGGSKVVPDIKARRWVTAAALAIGLGSLLQGLGLFGCEGSKGALGVEDELVDGVSTFRARRSRGRRFATRLGRRLRAVGLLI
jgi:hypothetical protein